MPVDRCDTMAGCMPAEHGLRHSGWMAWIVYGGPLPAVRLSDMTWRKSRASGGDNCVEIAAETSSILVRDSKNPRGPMLAFSGSEWTRFLARMDQPA
jgi:hypothetical protein